MSVIHRFEICLQNLDTDFIQIIQTNINNITWSCPHILSNLLYSILYLATSNNIIIPSHVSTNIVDSKFTNVLLSINERQLSSYNNIICIIILWTIFLCKVDIPTPTGCGVSTVLLSPASPDNHSNQPLARSRSLESSLFLQPPSSLISLHLAKLSILDLNSNFIASSDGPRRQRET